MASFAPTAAAAAAAAAVTHSVCNASRQRGGVLGDELSSGRPLPGHCQGPCVLLRRPLLALLVLIALLLLLRGHHPRWHADLVLRIRLKAAATIAS
jgi:hypothetical protein